ncbi:MAG TPA: DUF3656 domain-containing protein [Polyangia bacterium]|nr:DUF3656 domain-containing protein [Polyangia bacterium]
MLPSGPTRPARRRPEVLAPAGDLASLRAALAAGADAVYFGLDAGFNARARAANFSSTNLAETIALIHRAGARAYLALNTLVFERELGLVEDILRRVAAAGTDAIIVQDPAVALLAAAVCPTLEVHASTQMTVSSAEGAAFAAGLGVRRVVLPRELSVAEIRRLAEATDLELEVFIHGALCVSWSGQCLTSEAWGGRSANRGQCAQSCRLPYDLLVDGGERDLGDVRYLLSPKDLAGVRAVEALLDIGVHGLKIEGRQKGPQYVATAVTGYRHWVDALAASPTATATPADETALAHDLNAMALSYTRGFSDGFLAGSDHQTLVEGRFPKHRGLYLGRVREVRGTQVVIARAARPGSLGGLGLDDAGAPQAPVGTVASPLKGLSHLASVASWAGEGDPEEAADSSVPPPVAIRPGMGVVFDDGQPETEEVGGPVFQVEEEGDRVVLGFGRHTQGPRSPGAQGPDLRRVRPGQRVWVTSDPALARPTERLVEGPEPEGRIALGLVVSGAAGQPLRVRARILSRGTGPAARTPEAPECTVESEALLTPSDGAGLDPALLAAKLGALGGTPFRIAPTDRGAPQTHDAGQTPEATHAIDTSALAPGLHLPVSELKRMRRRIVEQLLPVIERGPAHEVTPGPQLERLHEAARARESERAAMRPEVPRRPPTLVPLCRTDGQLAAVIAADRAAYPEVELDWMEMVGLGRAVERARAAGLAITIATPRVQKPGEEGYDARIARLAPDGVLVRHWGAVMHFASAQALPNRPKLHGDFSLNVTNALTAHHLLDLGLDSLTAAHDLDAAQLFDLLAAAPARRFTIVVHHHVPTFHTEHCVYSHLLSHGRDHRSCGRPCERHEVALRDREGLVHPVVVDVGCRNTVFNARAQSAASLVPRLIERGVARLRIEFVRESEAEAARVLAAYQDLLTGRVAPGELVRRVGVHEQFGVTRGTMRVLG